MVSAVVTAQNDSVDSVESNMKTRFLADRLGIMGSVVGREREVLTILT